MKKNFVRIVAALLVAMLALTLIPMGAFAIDAIYVEKYAFDTGKPDASGNDVVDYLGDKRYNTGDTITAKDFDKYLPINGALYDFSGFSSVSSTNADINKKIDAYIEKYEPAADAAPEVWDKFIDDVNKYITNLYENTTLEFSKNNIKVDAYPVEPDASKYTDPNAYNAAMKAYTQACTDWHNKFDLIIAGYTPHQHKLSYWYSDGTTHWRECLVCKKFADQGFWEQFMYQNWCQDGDEDGICNICGGEVPYHDIKVIETEGATITLNRDNASHRMKITADVEAKDGYTAGKVHFVKVRDDGSKQEITRYKKNGQFFTYMPTYEMEVSVDVTKK